MTTTEVNRRQRRAKSDGMDCCCHCPEATELPSPQYKATMTSRFIGVPLSDSDNATRSISD